tara:strand:- start:20547 stop:22733 length:2187 start_codon:yes stop_codon:yes gene_type:complete
VNKSSILSDFIPGVLAGTINAIVCIVSAMALAALIFTGPLADYLSQGIGILLMGTVIFAILSAITSTYPLIFNAPQDIPIAILALMAATIVSGPNNNLTGEQAYQFIFVAIGLTSLIVGIFFYILGKFKLGELVRYIPFPVVGGFLAGTGWLIVKFAFTMMTDLDLNIPNMLIIFNNDVFILWFPGFVFAVFLLIANRYFNHYLLTPGILFGSIILFYIIMFAQGFNYTILEKNGYLLGPFPDGGLFPGLPTKYVYSFQWDLFFVHLPAIGTMMILNAVSVLFNYSGLELIVKEDFDLNKELRLTGYNNIIAGLAGTPAGYMTLSETSMSYNLGARSRLPSIIVALFCLITLVFGAKILSIFPKIILGGLLLNLGLEFLMEWLYDTKKRLQKTDYFVIVLILIVIGSIGFLEGIIIGLLLSIALFVINYSKVEVIKHQLTGKTFSSNVERSNHLKQILVDNGEEINILPLQGFIFFGTANRLLQKVQERLDRQELITMRYLVFDFRQVTGLDSSAINSLNKLQIMAENSKFKVLFCGLNIEMESQMKIEGLFSEDNHYIMVFDDLDHGLEWCEEQIINKVKPHMNDLAGLNDGYSFKNKFHSIEEYFETKKISAGTILIKQGKNPGGITFIESGEITVELKTDSDKTIRLKTLGPGTVIGEVSLYLGTKASASVLTNTDCTVFFLSQDNFNKMNLEAPEKAADLHSYIVKLLSDRLADSNATIKALMH